MNNQIKTMVSHMLLITLSASWLIFFVIEAVHGTVTFYEPNKVILGIELAICIIILGFGIERLHSFIKRNKGA